MTFDIVRRLVGVSCSSSERQFGRRSPESLREERLIAEGAGAAAAAAVLSGAVESPVAPDCGDPVGRQHRPREAEDAHLSIHQSIAAMMAMAMPMAHHFPATAVVVERKQLGARRRISRAHVEHRSRRCAARPRRPARLRCRLIDFLGHRARRGWRPRSADPRRRPRRRDGVLVTLTSVFARIARRKGIPAGQHLVQHDAEGEHVACADRPIRRAPAPATCS